MLTTTMMIMTNKAITIAAITTASERNKCYKFGKKCKTFCYGNGFKNEMILLHTILCISPVL